MLVILLCSFYLVNLILAIVAMSYDDCQRCEQAEIEAEYAAALVCTNTPLFILASELIMRPSCKLHCMFSPSVCQSVS